MQNAHGVESQQRQFHWAIIPESRDLVIDMSSERAHSIRCFCHKEGVDGRPVHRRERVNDLYYIFPRRPTKLPDPVHLVA